MVENNFYLIVFLRGLYFLADLIINLFVYVIKLIFMIYIGIILKRLIAGKVSGSLKDRRYKLVGKLLVKLNEFLFIVKF